MKISIKKRDLLDNIIWCVLFMQIMCFTWLNITRYTRLLLICLFILSLILNYKKNIKSNAVMLFLICIYMSFNFIKNGGSFHVFMSNFQILLPQFLLIIYASYIMQYKKDYLINLMKNKLVFWVINLYMLINIPVLILEKHGYYWLSGRSTVVNTYVPDLMSGLFGFNGTPYLAIFSVFFFIYNVNYYLYFMKRKIKFIFMIYNFCMLTFYIYISTQNDNKGFFLILIMFSIIYYLVTIISKEKYHNLYTTAFHVIKRMFPFVLMIFIVAVFLYKYTGVKDVVDLMIVKITEGFNYSSVRGGGERFGIVLFALYGLDNKFWGAGIGTHYWTEEYAFGYLHYGISDLGTFLCLGGIIFIIFIMLFAYVNFQHVLKNRFLTIIMLCALLILLIYTQVLTIPSVTISLMLFFMVCVTGKEIRTSKRKSGRDFS